VQSLRHNSDCLISADVAGAHCIEEEEEEELYKLLPANKADHLCQRMARTTGAFICP